MEITPAVVGVALTVFNGVAVCFAIRSRAAGIRAMKRERAHKEGEANILAREVQSDLARRMGQ